MGKTKSQQIICHETESVDEANALCASGEWRMPCYSIRRDVYVLIRKANVPTKES